MSRIIRCIGILCCVGFIYLCGSNGVGTQNTYGTSFADGNTNEKTVDIDDAGKEVMEHDRTYKTEKDRIYDMMLNSVENYTYAKGVMSATNNQLNNPTTTNFETDTRAGVAFEETTGNSHTSSVIVENGVKKVYLNGKLIEESDVVIYEKARERSGLSTLPTGELTHVMRKNATNLDDARLCLLPMEIAFSMLTNFDNWEIQKKESILGRECNVIVGEFDDYMSSKLNAKSFLIMEDDKTGVLIKYEAYDSDGKVVDYAIMKEIVIE